MFSQRFSTVFSKKGLIGYGVIGAGPGIQVVTELVVLEPLILIMLLVYAVISMEL